MADFLQTLEDLGIDWFAFLSALLSAIWTFVLVPIGAQIYKWLQSKKLDKYATILYEEVVKAVKGIYESVVKDIKGSEDWTDEKKSEVRELAKTKTIQALNNSIFKCLQQANEDFETYLDSLIDTALFDVKNGIK